MSKKNTKRALLSSVLALVLCLSMLIGTTFAWFTDSVTSGVNKIIAGNLDVEVYYGDPKDKNSIEGVDTLFNDVTLWEPGAVAWENLTVVNEGTLALKYGLGINFSNENNVDGYGLSQILQIAVVPGGVDTTKTREEIVAGISTWQKLSAWYEGGKLLSEENATEEEPSSVTYGVVIWWQPSNQDNNWNVNNGKITSDGQPLHIDLGISLTAWQLEYEEDSFGSDYDANLVVTTVEEANARIAAGEDVILFGANEPTGVITIPAAYTGTLTLNNVSIASVQAEEKADIVIDGVVTVKAVEENTSAVTGTELNISGSGVLNAVGNGKHAYGIGGANTTAITIDGITIDYVAGGYVGGVGTDTKYYKDAPEGGAGIGSGTNGAGITLKNVTINKAIGGSKAAGIGALYHTGVTVNITGSTIAYVEGGVSAAGIGGSRISNGATTAENVTINIENSTITAQGGAYGAGIGSGYDTYCQSNQPICTINISGSDITATGGKYAAGVGTGYHHAALAGEIENSTVNAASGEKFYKDTYTQAQDIGFGVVDPAREGTQTDSYIICNGVNYTIPAVPATVSVTPDNLSNITFASNTKYNLIGDFGGALVNLGFNANGLENVVIDGTNATNIQELIVNANVSIVDGATSGSISGNVSIVNFTGANLLSVFAYDTEVEIGNNNAKALYVLGRNLNLNIHDNAFDADFAKFAVHNPSDLNEYAWPDYAVTLNICEYELKFDNNTVTDSMSHAVGVNGYEATYATQNGRNKIVSFTGNSITVNSTVKTKRAALKIWADVVYAPQNADHSVVNAASQELIDTILAEASNNTITVLEGYSHSNFQIYDASVNQ